MVSHLPRSIGRPDAIAARLRKALATLALAMTFVLPTGPAMAADAFVPGLEDVPLMPGLTADVDAVVLFDRPDVRLVEADAVGPVTADAVRRFYAETLPQLGWQADGADTFRREGERLLVVVEQTGTTTMVRFRLMPLDGPAGAPGR